MLERLLVFFMMISSLKCKQALLLFLSVYHFFSYALFKCDCPLLFCFYFKVYSISDLRYANEPDLLSLGMSKPQFRKIKRHMPSSYNTTLSNNTMLSSTTLGKLLARVSICRNKK